MAWQAVFIASNQNSSGVLYSPSIVLAMSISVLFFLSTAHHFVVVCRERRTRAWCLPPQDILRLEGFWTQIHYRSLSFSPLAQIRFELSLRSALEFLEFQIFPAKRKPKWSGKIINNDKTILTSPDVEISNRPEEIHMQEFQWSWCCHHVLALMSTSHLLPCLARCTRSVFLKTVVG